MNSDISLNRPLPLTWPMARLKHIASVRYGKGLAADDREKTGRIPVFGSSTTTGFHDEPFHHKPSIVIGRKGSVGSIQYVDVPFWPIDTVFFLDDVSPYVDLRFLAAALSYFGLERYKIAVGVPGINRGDLENFQFPLPPMSEQQRIVEILQEAEEIRRLRSEAEAKTAEIAPAMFNAIFGSPPDWKDGSRLGDLVNIVGGGTPSRSIEHYYSGEIPWATSKDIKKLYLDDTEEHVTEEAVRSSATNVVPKGTVLVVVKSKILMHSLPVAITQVPMCFGQDIKGLIPKEGITPEFLVYSLQAQLGRILSRARGANTEGLTLEALKSLNMPKPTSDLIERFRIACKEIRGLKEASIAGDRINLQTSASLSAHAFSGQLTTEWREANRDKLADEAIARDAALKEAGAVTSRIRSTMDQEIEELLQDRTDGIYAELNREQRQLLNEIRRMVGGVHYARYFTAQGLSDYLAGGPLHRNPQAIEGHLAILAARGLIIPVSREEQTEDTGMFVFGNAYRLPMEDYEPREGDESEPQIGDRTRLRELERLAAQLAKERIQT
jgi:type I restriction enzyme S subunit